MKDVNNEQNLNKPLLEEIDGDSEVGESPDSSLLNSARTMFAESTDYLDSNIREEWEASIAHFDNRHAPGSKYHKDLYKTRSKTFRPKPRASIRAQEAAFFQAVFSTKDMLTIKPKKNADAMAKADAEITQYLTQYRLEESLNWFMTCMGAYQDGHKYGVCFSHNYWKRDYSPNYEVALDEFGEPMFDEDGQMLGEEVSQTILEDKPCVDLRPPENIRFSPAADWRDPMQSSSYLIDIVPMPVADIEARMEFGDWNQLTRQQILATGREFYDETRSQREGNREDPLDQDKGQNQFSIRWPRQYIIREGGEDYCFWTLGDEQILTEKQPLSDVYPHLRRGERPYRMGIVLIESHKNYPSGTLRLGAGLAEEINDIANTRMDNVRLAINKRYITRRGAQIDMKSLVRSTPGGGVIVNDIGKDLKVLETRDVTSSAYVEQDRLSNEHDELTGVFSQQSVAANRNLNETVGGMEKLSGAANVVQEYTIAIFNHTWLEPTIKDIVRMEQYYESDEVILALAADESDAFQKFGQSVEVDDLLRHNLTVEVNVGVGSTDPIKRVEKLVFGLSHMSSLPGIAERLNSEEIADEIMGSLGYKSAERFLMSEEDIKEKQGEPVPDPSLQMAQIRAEVDRYKADKDFDAAMARLAQEEKITIGTLYEKLGLEREKEKTKRDVAALSAQQKNNELAFKAETGRDGI